MKALKLSPLPSLRADANDAESLLMEREGFVDESVVRSLLYGTYVPRVTAYPEDLALTADDSDFAGWQLPPAMPARAAEVPPHVIDAIIRRAAPPVATGRGLGSPQPGGHRWWLAGLAGVLCTLLFSLLLFTLFERPEADFEALPAPRALATPAPLPSGMTAPAELSPGR